MSNCVTTPTEDAPWGPLSVYRDSIIHVKRRSSNCSTSPQLFSPFCPPRVVGDGVEEKVGTRLCGLREFREAQTLRVELPSYSNSCNTLLVILASKWCSIYLGSTVDTPHVFPAPSIEMDLRFFFSYTLDEFSLLSRCKSIAGRCLLVLLECGYFVESLSKQFRTKPFGPNKSI